MKTYQNRKQQFGAIAGAGLILVSLFAVSFQSLTFAQESTQTTNDRDKKTQAKSMCPMMAGLNGIRLTSDSPPLLMARADELKLTEKQKQELKSIAEEAQRKAAKILTAEQQSILGESTNEAMSMMEIAMMRSKDMRNESGMCPMCKRKMEGMRKMKMMKGKKSGGEESTSN
ncbi:MAG: hypothetical protein KDB27_01405 [Planctomycetales bacterium]|nr:hypothetical protein [Planctomycetales bacterium]